MKSLTWLAVGASLIASGALQAGSILAGHAGLRGQTLDGDGIKAVLLGKKITLAGVRVVIIIARVGETQDSFLQARIGMTTSQFQNYWRRLFMTGGGTAPRIVETEADAREITASTPGAVVIIDSAHADGFAVLFEN